MAEPQPRTVKAHKSYGYLMEKPDGKESRLDFEAGQKIYGISEFGKNMHAIKIKTATGEVAAHYKLL